MEWNDHHQLEGQHAFLGASQFRWLNYDDQLLFDRYYGQYATSVGTAAHTLAHDCICSRTKLNKQDKHLVEITMYKNFIPKGAYDADQILLNMIPFVNDAIGFHMSSEIILFYSYKSFGTTDAISFNEKENCLRISDLKTGSTPAHMEQLLIYAALFCLEYHKNPNSFKTCLKIYQNFEVTESIPDPKDIQNIMDIIVNDCSKLNEFAGSTQNG